MKDKSKRLNLIEGILDTLMAGALNNNNEQEFNPPTPSLNNFDNAGGDNIVITKGEARELRNLLGNLMKELYYKQEEEIELSIEDTKEYREEINKFKEGKEEMKEEHLFKFIDKVIELEDRFKKLNTKITEIEGVQREKIHKESSKEGEVLNKVQRKKRSYCFYEELRNHAQNFDYIKVLVVSGDSCCEIEGVIMDLHKDFIVLLGKNNNLIKILLDKMVAVERLIEKDKDKVYSSDDEDEDIESFENIKENIEDDYLEEFEEGAAAQKLEVEGESESRDSLEEKRRKFKVL
ncbi:hypothetical protein [Halonatronum saccharophilum]|uniref:hypothetical protein n=1 Tax=Halonatronum saccharophilum TaxID=150060 RepID=UPI000485883D|nr:hypothetical protein [Halonatronum saccharophilum]